MTNLKFSAVRETGTTYEIPMDKAKEVLDKYGVDYSTWNEDELAEELYNFYRKDIEEYEIEEVYCNTYVQDVEVE